MTTDKMNSSFSDIFSLDPNHFPYTKQFVLDVRKRRSEQSGVLFFDLVLLEVAQVQNGSNLYPPSNLADLRHLYEAISHSPVDELKKQCCFYYILRDWNMQKKYAEENLIPSNYCLLMDSYWFLEKSCYEEALRRLVSPGLNANFGDKILDTLFSAEQYSALIKYIQTTQMILETESKKRIYLMALLQLDISQAIFYTRSVLTPLRQTLLDLVIEHCIKIEHKAIVVANFPFEKMEEKWIMELLKGRNGAGRDILVLRLFHTGRIAESIKLARDDSSANYTPIRNLERSLTQIETRILDGC